MRRDICINAANCQPGHEQKSVHTSYAAYSDQLKSTEADFHKSPETAIDFSLDRTDLKRQLKNERKRMNHILHVEDRLVCLQSSKIYQGAKLHS